MILPRWLRDRLMPARFRREVAAKAVDREPFFGVALRYESTGPDVWAAADWNASQRRCSPG